MRARSHPVSMRRRLLRAGGAECTGWAIVGDNKIAWLEWRRMATVEYVENSLNTPLNATSVPNDRLLPKVRRDIGDRSISLQ